MVMEHSSMTGKVYSIKVIAKSSEILHIRVAISEKCESGLHASICGYGIASVPGKAGFYNYLNV